MKRMIAYLRISKEEAADKDKELAEEKKKKSLLIQKQAIEQFAQGKDWELTVFQDAGVSGGRERRPALDAALDALRKHQFDGIVVSRFDRLTRGGVVHLAKLIEAARKEGWNLVIMDLALALDTPVGEMMATMLATVARYEIRIMSQRIKDVLAMKRSRGEPLGSARIIPMETVGLASNLYADLRSWRGVARTLNDRGVPAPKGGRWFCSTARNVVTRHLTEAAK